MPRDRYQSLGTFYAAAPARRGSRKVDYGVWWRARPPRRGIWFPPWRVTYVRDTGELFATPLSGDGPVLVLAVLPPLPGSGWTAELDRRLAGWDDPELTGWQLSWVRNRLAPRVALAREHRRAA